MIFFFNDFTTEPVDFLLDARWLRLRFHAYMYMTFVFDSFGNVGLFLSFLLGGLSGAATCFWERRYGFLMISG